MSRTVNTSFTHNGSFNPAGVLLATALLAVSSLCYAGAGTVDSLAAVYKKTDDAENFTYACLDHYLATPTEDNLPVFDAYEKARWRQPGSADEQLAYVILLCNKGFYLSRFGNIYEGIDAYEKAWKLFQDNHLANLDIIEYCLKPLGNNYSMLGDYTSAANIIKTYLFLAGQQNNYGHVAGAVINLSVIYHDTGRHRQAIDILTDTWNMAGIPADKKGMICAGLAKNYVAVGELARAEHFANLSLNLFDRHKNFDTPVLVVNSYKILSLISLQKKDTARALHMFDKARSIAAAHTAAFKARELAKLLLEHGNLLKLTAQYTPAAQAYRQALTVLLPAYRPQREEDLPDAASFYAENAIKESLDGLGDLYEKQNRPLHAVACYELSFTVEDLLRATYNHQSAKLQQQVENRRRAERIIRLLWQLGEQAQDARYAFRAFQVAERTKALTLKEITEDRYARQPGRHDSLLVHESRLLFKQASLANELVLEQNKQEQANTAHVRELINRQAQLTIEIKSVQKAIDIKYSGYATRLPEWPDTRMLQQKLSREEAVLVEYFSGTDGLYQFILSADSLGFCRLEKSDSINRSILALGHLFSTANGIGNNTDAYKKLAFALFRQLRLNGITQKKMVLVPDGLLHTIPFDALLYQEAPGFRYADFPYLIKKHSIAYQPSAWLYAHARNAAVSLNNQAMLALFPVFENTPQSLAYSLDEAENIQHYFGKGKYLLKGEATKEAFLEQAPHYAIIHLSTHALPGNDTEPPSIRFRDSVLYLPQIYGLQMNPDLMVLSACETGVGKIASGEGALSLAHGFQFAGVHNIILSLWKVNDRSTSILFSGFYRRYLETGQKAVALRQAKLDYLADASIQNIHKSPFYWAAFIYYGKFETPAPPSSLTLYMAVGGGAMFMLAAAYTLLKRKRRNAGT